MANYSYSNGNLTGDSGKGMGIDQYNFLEQPQNITTDDGRIELTYDALGNKLQKRIYAEGFNPDNGPFNECVAEALMKQQDYLLDYLYRWHYPETKPNSSEPKFRVHRFYHEEGSIEWRRISEGTTNAPYETCFQYTIRDHLGNGRVYFTKDYDNDGLLDVLQESHYYPFGAQIEGLSKLYDPPGGVPYASNGYVYTEENNPTYIEYRQYTHDLKRYNGKEFNRELGLNWYDYGARWYDPVIGRWNAVDPLAEKFYGWSPFNYVLNNPLRLVDPDGRSPNGGSGTPPYLFQKIGEAATYIVNDLVPTIADKTVETFRAARETQIGQFVEEMANETIGAFVDVGSAVIFPMINQTKIVIKEGVHEGYAYNRENNILPNTYTLDEDWNLIPQGPMGTMGGSEERSKEFMKNTVKVLTTIAGGPKETLVERGATMATKSAINKATEKLLEVE
ncbi:MAG: RHS repeat-associated core domain-containing protein [Chitinophagales bacterium]